MSPQSLKKLIEKLGIDAADLAARLGGARENYESLLEKERIPFPVWDALQRMAFREGLIWDAGSESWLNQSQGATTHV
ncbi:MAG: hypothetical protein QGF00_25400 [Planctomycetota bacterium]|jgi:hypothetical protein|nr:hypothetical protein [Planctomycetota bacterium]MDP7252965.1 hypothetical protein [Planctomycetota bacterium]